jgi:hypothetical protein
MRADRGSPMYTGGRGPRVPSEEEGLLARAVGACSVVFKRLSRERPLVGTLAGLRLTHALVAQEVGDVLRLLMKRGHLFKVGDHGALP